MYKRVTDLKSSANSNKLLMQVCKYGFFYSVLMFTLTGYAQDQQVLILKGGDTIVCRILNKKDSLLTITRGDISPLEVMQSIPLSSVDTILPRGKEIVKKSKTAYSSDGRKLSTPRRLTMTNDTIFYEITPIYTFFSRNGHELTVQQVGTFLAVNPKSLWQYKAYREARIFANIFAGLGGFFIGYFGVYAVTGWEEYPFKFSPLVGLGIGAGLAGCGLLIDLAGHIRLKKGIQIYNQGIKEGVRDGSKKVTTSCIEH